MIVGRFVGLGGHILVKAEGAVYGHWLVIEYPKECFLTKAEGVVGDGVKNKIVHHPNSMIRNNTGDPGDNEHGVSRG